MTSLRPGFQGLLDVLERLGVTAPLRPYLDVAPRSDVGWPS